MENRFKAGDFIECIDGGMASLTEGLVYEVLKNVKTHNGDGAITIKDDGGRCDSYNCNRFKLAKQEQEPNYMMVWDIVEKEAEKLEVFADLSDNPRYNNVYPVHVIKNDNTERHLHAKTIEQWKKDTGFLFENSLHERFFKGDVVYWVIKEENTINSKKINVVNVYGDNADTSEIMTKESAEKYIKEHEVKYRPFTMEEFDEVGIKLIDKKNKKRYTVAHYGEESVTVRAGGQFSYLSLLETFTLIDGTPCGVKE